ncbi:hypothetical protein JHV666_49670 [Mycobacterium avium subsp. hominissuis]
MNVSTCCGPSSTGSWGPTLVGPQDPVELGPQQVETFTLPADLTRAVTDLARSGPRAG